MPRALALALAALTLVGQATCAPARRDAASRPPAVREVDPSSQIRRLEQLLAAAPRHPRARLDLARAHFQLAQEALDRDDQPLYTRQLARAQGALLEHMERAPSDPAAHIQLGIVVAHRGDLVGARRSFRIAAQLDPRDPIAQLNLAEVAVYRNAVPEAQQRLRLARLRGLAEADAELIEVLAAWKQGDLVEARERFRVARDLDPERVRAWNGARSIATFEDLASHCCRLRFCGPHMVKACDDMGQAVAAQELEEATVLRELQLEMERTRRIRELYERRRDLEIQVDEPEAGEATDEPEAPEPPRRR